MLPIVRSGFYLALFVCVSALTNTAASANQGAEDRALLEAVKKGQLITVQTLLDEGGNVNVKDADGQPALNWAVRTGNAQLVTLLVSRGAAKSEAENSAIDTARHIAMRLGYQDIVRILSSEKVPSPDAAMLANAIADNDLEGVSEALLIGISANSLDFTGRPVLALAARRGNVTALELLLKHGAQIDQTDEIGFTALMEAVRNQKISAAVLLLKAGANPDILSKDSTSAAQMIKASDNAGLKALIKR